MYYVDYAYRRDTVAHIHSGTVTLTQCNFFDIVQKYKVLLEVLLEGPHGNNQMGKGDEWTRK